MLASGEAVLGPLQDAAKLISKSTSDYSTLSGSVSTIDYKETHILTRGTNPFKSKQTIVQHHYLDTVDNKTSVSDTFTTIVDSNGVVHPTTVSHDTFPHGIGNAYWKCAAYNQDGSLVAQSELYVEPTRLKVMVEVGRYANTRTAYPGRTMVWLDAPCTVLRDCDLGGTPKEWSYQTSVSPAYPTILTFRGANMVGEYLPTIQIGYSKQSIRE